MPYRGGNARGYAGIDMPRALPIDLTYSLDDIGRTNVIEIPICDSERAMTELPLDDANVDPGVGQFARTSVPEPVYVNSLLNTSLLRVTLEHAADIGVREPPSFVSTEYEVTIEWADSNPFADSLEGLLVGSDHPTLTALTLEYSDGVTIEVDVAKSKVKCFVAPKLTPQVDHQKGFVANACRRLWERLKDFLKRFVSEDLWLEC